MTWIIQEARESDAAALAALLNPIIAAGRLGRRQPVSEAEQRDYIRNFPAAGVLLVACDEAGRVVGLQSTSPPDHGVGASFTFVAMDHHRQGVGRVLTSAMFGAARAKSCRGLRASIPNGNPWALAFYYAMDFHWTSGAWPHDMIAERSTDVIALTPLQAATCAVLEAMRLSGIDEAAATAAHGAEAVAAAKVIVKEAIDAPVDWRHATMDQALVVLSNLLGKRYPWLTVKARASITGTYTYTYK